MAGLITKVVFNKILRENPSNNQGRADPYFETVPAARLSTSRTKKVRRALPPGLSPEDERTLVKVKRRAYRLDMAFGEFCGMKVGWSSLIAIIPGIGDVADMLLAMMVVRTASEANLPASVKLQMVFNVVIDFVIGLIPFLGDLMDIAFKANTRNAIVLEDYLRQRGAANIAAQGLPPQQDPSLGANYDQLEDQQPLAQPPPAYQGGGMRGGWFGGSQRREDDLEAARGSRREDDLEAARGSRREDDLEAARGSRREGGGGSGGERHKSSRHGGERHGGERHKSSKSKSSRDNSARMGRQENGATVR